MCSAPCGRRPRHQLCSGQLSDRGQTALFKKPFAGTQNAETLLTGQSCPELQPHWKLDASQRAGWDCGHAETLSGGVPAPPGPGCGVQTPHSSLATCDAEHGLRRGRTDSRVSFAPSADGSASVAQPPGGLHPIPDRPVLMGSMGHRLPVAEWKHLGWTTETKFSYTVQNIFYHHACSEE